MHEIKFSRNPWDFYTEKFTKEVVIMNLNFYICCIMESNSPKKILREYIDHYGKDNMFNSLLHLNLFPVIEAFKSNDAELVHIFDEIIDIKTWSLVIERTLEHACESDTLLKIYTDKLVKCYQEKVINVETYISRLSVIMTKRFFNQSFDDFRCIIPYDADIFGRLFKINHLYILNLIIKKDIHKLKYFYNTDGDILIYVQKFIEDKSNEHHIASLLFYCLFYDDMGQIIRYVLDYFIKDDSVLEKIFLNTIIHTDIPFIEVKFLYNLTSIARFPLGVMCTNCLDVLLDKKYHRDVDLFVKRCMPTGNDMYYFDTLDYIISKHPNIMKAELHANSHPALSATISYLNLKWKE